jgi:hypothetical protein
VRIDLVGFPVLLGAQSRNLEERMRVEMPVVLQSPIDSPKSIEKKELTAGNSNGANEPEETQAFFPSPLGLGRTYSVSSLKAAVNYHAKFLTVAASNVQAAQHDSMIPQSILNYFNAR